MAVATEYPGFVRVMLGLATFVAVLSVVGSAGGASTPGFQLRPCPNDPFTGDPVFPPTLRVDCGTLAVPENRARPNGRTIRFAAAIVHAPVAKPKPDPIVFLDGGPSFGAINSFAMDFYFAGASYIRDRDVILVDTRGAGTSEPRLGCPELDQADHDTFYAKPFIGSGFGPTYDDALRACRGRLVGAGIDLSAYNSAETAVDLEALRKALGYKQWNLWAISADGVAGLTYMRLYPGGIRSAVLDSPQSTQMMIGVDYLRGRMELLERVFTGCAANTACAARYPNLRTVFYDLVHELQAHPVNVHVHLTGADITVHVDGIEFFFQTWDGLFPDNVQNLFSGIWRSAHGELNQVVQEFFGTDPPTFDQDVLFARGKTQSYVCHDVVGFIPQSEYNRAAADFPELAPEILGHYFDHTVGRAGCAIWNNGLADPAQHQPVSSRIPTLITDGEFDLGVPPFIVRQISPTLRNSFFFEFPATFHLQFASYNPVADCARAIAAEFLNAPTRRPASSGCVASQPQFDYTP